MINWWITVIDCLLWWSSIVSSCCHCCLKKHVLRLWPISNKEDALLKPNSKNITQTIFQGCSLWAALIFNSMFVVVVLYCVQLLPEVTNFQTFLLPFPLLNPFYFTFLVPFFWNSQCPISQNKWCLIKAQLKVKWNQLNVNWNQLKVNLKSIEHQLKSIESKLKSIENQSIESKLKVYWNQLKINWSQLIPFYWGSGTSTFPP